MAHPATPQDRPDPDIGSRWHAIAQLLSDLDDKAASGSPADTTTGEPFSSIATVSADRIRGAEWVSVTVQTSPGHFRTAAATDIRAERADQLQYDLGSGPCVDAIADDTIYCPRDLLEDERWPQYGQAVATAFGVRSMLSYRMTLDGGDVLGCLNVYATTPHAFDADAVAIGEIIATHAALVITQAHSAATAAQLQQALNSNREIGVAVGVLMNAHKLTREQAFNLLRLASQNSNRKLRDVATDVADTGQVTLRHPR